MKKMKRMIACGFATAGLLISMMGMPVKSHALTSSVVFKNDLNVRILDQNGTGVTDLTVSAKAYEHHILVKNQKFAGTFINNSLLFNGSVPHSANGEYVKSVSSPGARAFGNPTYSSTNTAEPTRGQNTYYYMTYFKDLDIQNVPNYIKEINNINPATGTQYTKIRLRGVIPRAPAANNTVDYDVGVQPLTKIGPGHFQLKNTNNVTYPVSTQLVANYVSSGTNLYNLVPFAYALGTWWEGGPSNGQTFGHQEMAHYYDRYSTVADQFTYFYHPYKIEEYFVDTTGSSLGADMPTGFTDGNTFDADNNIYTMDAAHGQQNSLPTSYSKNGKHFVLKGWYQGTTKPATLETSNPPSFDWSTVSSGQEEEKRKVTVVYAEAQKLTEKHIDQSGATIDATWDPTAPTVVEKGETFTIPYTVGQTKTTAGGTDWEYVGWKYSTDAAGTVNTTTKTAAINADATIQYIFKESKTTATLDLNPTPQIVPNSGGTVSWTSRLTNTGSADLKDLVLKQLSNWSAGLSEPVQVTVTPASGPAMNFPVVPGDLSTGVNLAGITIPHGGASNYADITFTTTATGVPNQVLLAEIEVDGNLTSKVSANNYVRIDDPDEPNLKPTGKAGFINVPKFEFGTVAVSPFSTTHKLDGSQYQSHTKTNGLYVRFFDMDPAEPHWSLSAKLAPITSGSDTLASSTKLVMNNTELGTISNVNKPTEAVSYSGSPASVSLTADNTSSTISVPSLTTGYYQTKLPFNDVELQLAGNQGVAGQSYHSDLTWTLTTAP